MDSAISGFARGGKTASRDVEVHRRHTHYIWRSNGIHESIGLLVRDALALFPPFFGASEQDLFLTT